MSNATIGMGTTIARNGNAIGELNSIGGISIKRDMVDVTTLLSTGGYEEVLPGVKKTGSVPMEGNFYPGDTNGQIGLQSDLDNGTLQSFVITFPATTGTTFTFTGYVEEFTVDKADPSGVLPFKASIKISGQPSLGITLSNNITALTPSGSGTMIPLFTAATYGIDKPYVYSVATGISSITITPTFAAGVCTITAPNGQSQTVTSGNASGAIALNGATTVTTIDITVKESGKSPKVYRINVARA